MKRLSMFVLLAVAATLAAETASLPSVFSDGMVLQRGQKVPVWGKGAPGERVTVTFAGQSAAATAGADGRWRVDLAPLAASKEGREFRVKGENEVVLRDVLVGEVWFCSGQSNMEYPMATYRKIKDWEREVAAANHPTMRYFQSPNKAALTPQDDIAAKWTAVTPETVPPYSAVAYTFGETLMKELDVPVGLIEASWGGTRIEPWTPAAHPDDLWLLQNIRKWSKKYDVPTALWNGMVAGLVPYAIKGAIWYQGCANRIDGAEYLDKTEALVRGWRREWGQGDFPYYLVQLAPYKYDDVKGVTLFELQLAQSKVPERVPNSGYTVINDVGDVNDIHPNDKRTVGMRMADQVLERVYGKVVRPWRTPVAKSWRAEGDEARVTFENADGLRTRDGKAPTEFELRGADGVWRAAAARIEGCDVVLSAEGVLEPIGVRFAPYNGSTPNLVNGAGLPAGPFRMTRPMPFGAAEKIAEADGYRCIVRYDIPVCCDLAKKPPAMLGEIGAAARIAYLLELEDKDGDTTYAFAEMDVPEGAKGALTLNPVAGVRAHAANLKVRSNGAGLAGKKLSGDGFVEIYFANYSPKTQGDPEGGDDRKYDFNDTPNAHGDALGYGCLQIHDLGAKTTVLAFNHFNNSSTPCDVGIGSSKGEHPDWTFARNAGDWKRRRISVWAK